jgi:hypothetical protein
MGADGRHIVASGDNIGQVSGRVGAARVDLDEVVLEEN